jgi:hypothetical protein
MSDEAEAACASSDEGKPAPAAGGAYNGMIKPLLNMTIYGAVWYQGESNQVRSCSLYLSLQNLPPFRDKTCVYQATLQTDIQIWWTATCFHPYADWLTGGPVH